MSNEILVCQFVQAGKGPYCPQPIGQFPTFGRVYLDRKNTIEVVLGKTYLCRIVHSTQQKVHFVVVLMSTVKFLKDLLPALAQAKWQRGKGATDDVVAEPIYVEGCGEVRASWYESTAGKAETKFVTLKGTFSGEDFDFTVSVGEAPEEIAVIEKRVRQCTGPAVDLGALIARRRETRQLRW